MRKGQNRKVNSTGSLGSIGRVSCLGLLALGLALANPISSSSAFAEEGMNVETDGANDSEVPSSNDTDYSISTQATTDSTVTISFLPTSASGTVTPVDNNGDKAKVDVQAKVEVKNSGGYKVYVGSSSNQLKNGSNVINPVSAATTYANLPLNSWGFSFRKASSSTDKTVADSYSAMPATLRSSVLDSNTSTSISSETRYYMLSFAARIGSDKPAGTYANSVTMSVVSSPLTIADEFAYEFDNITSMQEMTTAICSKAPIGGIKQLKDTRDGKYYWIGKMKDGKCWMTQNLDLDLSTSKKLTSDDSDVSAEEGYTPVFDTATAAMANTLLNNATGQRSWSLGNVRITNPDISNDCGGSRNSAADCTNQFASYATPTEANGDVNAHYILGNHYQWNTATAGTGGTIKSEDGKYITASSSICPRGWRLPTAEPTTGEYTALVTALGGTGSTNNITRAPFYGVRSGDVNQGAAYLYSAAGSYGNYWSSTPSTKVGNAYYLYFGGTTVVLPFGDNAQQSGRSVRCIAK